MSNININGKVYSGGSIVVNNGKITIDGKEIDGLDERVININIEGSVQNLDVDCANSITVNGDVVELTSKNGNVSVSGDVSGNVENKNGNINCGNVGGDVLNKNGNIKRN